MSDRDKQLLDYVQLTQQEVAKALNLSRQAVGKGVNAYHHYLGIDKLWTLHKYLLEENISAAERLKKFVDGEPTLDNELFDIDLTKSDPDDPNGTDFEEMWVISGHPRELDREYIKRDMLEHLEKAGCRIIYFVPSTISPVLHSRLAASLDDAEISADVSIYECEAARMVPHLIIFEANTPNRDPHGVVLGFAGKKWPWIEQQHVGLVIDEIKAAMRDTDHPLKIRLIHHWPAKKSDSPLLGEELRRQENNDHDKTP